MNIEWLTGNKEGKDQSIMIERFLTGRVRHEGEHGKAGIMECFSGIIIR